MPKRPVTLPPSPSLPPLASQLLTTAWRTSPRNSNLLPWINHIMEPFKTNIETTFPKVIWDFQLSVFPHCFHIIIILFADLRLNRILNWQKHELCCQLKPAQGWIFISKWIFLHHRVIFFQWDPAPMNIFAQKASKFIFLHQKHQD